MSPGMRHDFVLGAVPEESLRRDRPFQHAERGFQLFKRRDHVRQQIFGYRRLGGRGQVLSS